MREKYESLQLVQLKELAKARGLRGISTMKKADLVELMLAQDEKDKASLAEGGVREIVKAPRKTRKSTQAAVEATENGAKSAGAEDRKTVEVQAEKPAEKPVEKDNSQPAAAEKSGETPASSVRSGEERTGFGKSNENRSNDSRNNDSRSNDNRNGDVRNGRVVIRTNSSYSRDNRTEYQNRSRVNYVRNENQSARTDGGSRYDVPRNDSYNRNNYGSYNRDNNNRDYSRNSYSRNNNRDYGSRNDYSRGDNRNEYVRNENGRSDYAGRNEYTRSEYNRSDYSSRNENGYSSTYGRTDNGSRAESYSRTDNGSRAESYSRTDNGNRQEGYSRTEGYSRSENNTYSRTDNNGRGDNGFVRNENTGRDFGTRNDFGRNEGTSQEYGRAESLNRAENSRTENSRGEYGRQNVADPAAEELKKTSESQAMEAKQQETGAVKTGEEGQYPKELDSGIEARGILEVMADGYGFIRCENYMPGDNDVYVAPSQIRRFGLKTGDILCGNKRVKTQQEKFSALLYVSSINGYTPEEAAMRKNFEDMTPIFPNERIKLETPGCSVAMRVMDLVSPVGKGQRGMIVSPPKAGKTTLLKEVAKSVLSNRPDMHMLILLIDERPEEVTDIKEAIHGENVEVIYSTFDELPEHHKRVSEMVIERAKRLVEHKKDVVILLDSITRLTRAYNLVVPPSGRTLSGGLDPAALHMPKRFFGAARNIREGGSLTILATALVDTGSKMDDVVYEEFKGTGNMEMVLDRKLSEKRIFPAIDLQKSGTRREDLLLNKEELEAIGTMRKALNGLKPEEATDKILDMFSQTKCNRDFVNLVNKNRFL